MLVVDGRRLIASPFKNEDELERVVLDNYQHIFGPDSILLPKKLIRSADGAGTIPDAFAVDLLQRRWFIVEAELAHHGVWRHIAPQVAKQLAAASQVGTRATLVDAVIELFKTDVAVQATFDEQGIPAIDVHQVVAGIFQTEPIVALPIDEISKDLRLWAEQLKVEVRLWTIRKLVDFDEPNRVAYEIPDEFRPTVDTLPGGESPSSLNLYEVSVSDLIEAGMLSVGSELVMRYKPRGGEQRTYTATLHESGSINLLGEEFSSLSYAALRGINDAGSDRNTVNGWRSWSTSDGVSLYDLRAEYLASRQGSSETS